MPTVRVPGQAKGSDPGAGEGQGRTSSFLSRRPFRSPNFLLAADQDDEGDDPHDKLTDVYEQSCRNHKQTVPCPVAYGSGSRKTSNY